jgi:hypothetical protein
LRLVRDERQRDGPHNQRAAGLSSGSAFVDRAPDRESGSYGAGTWLAWGRGPRLAGRWSSSTLPPLR